MGSGSDDTKRDELQRRGTAHPHPERVTDPLFDGEVFFDRHDAVQVKYEMLRSVQLEGRPVSQAAVAFGFSRPTFYEARRAFEQHGMPGLLPAKKGPRRAHKLSDEIMEFVDERLAAEPALSIEALAEIIGAHFGLSVHPRSISRALGRRRSKKNRGTR
jgi:transposase